MNRLIYFQVQRKCVVSVENRIDVMLVNECAVKCLEIDRNAVADTIKKKKFENKNEKQTASLHSHD